MEKKFKKIQKKKLIGDGYFGLKKGRNGGPWVVEWYMRLCGSGLRSTFSFIFSLFEKMFFSSSLKE